MTELSGGGHLFQWMLLLRLYTPVATLRYSGPVSNFGKGWSDAVIFETKKPRLSRNKNTLAVGFEIHMHSMTHRGSMDRRVTYV